MEGQCELDRWASNSTNPSLKASGALWLLGKLEEHYKLRMGVLVNQKGLRLEENGFTHGLLLDEGECYGLRTMLNIAQEYCGRGK